MDGYILKNQIELIILISIFTIITILFIIKSISYFSNKKYKDVIFPIYKANSKEFISEEKKKAKEKTGLKKNILNFFSKRGLDEKVKIFYVQAGYYDKTIEDLLIKVIKFLILSTILGLCIYYCLSNIWISLLLSLFFFSFPFIDLWGNVQDRRNAFRRDFPYFLQTLSFVLNNGSNMTVAFNEVVKKQNEGVLKEVMLDVITTQKVNGGDFTKAFSNITNKINIEETKEFVEIVQNSLEKGVSVAEIFSSQSETISRFIRNKKIKKIKNVSTKILLPILFILGAIVIYFI